MSANKPTRPITTTQIIGILASTLALFFMVAFATKSLDAYRLRSLRERLRSEIAAMERERADLEEELRRRDSEEWLDQVLRDAGHVPEGVVSVVVVQATVPAPQPTPVAEPTPATAAGFRTPSLFRNPHWKAWQQLIWGFDADPGP